MSDNLQLKSMSSPRTIRSISISALSLLVMCISSCSLDNAVAVDDPDGNQQLDRKFIGSREGAISLYNEALGLLQKGVSATSQSVGLFTDELSSLSSIQGGISLDVDARIEGFDTYGRKYISLRSYDDLQRARILASHARQVFKRIEDFSLRHYIAASYALEAYSVLLLAENVCSGIPFSTVFFEGGIQYSSGLSTEESLQLAVTLFDSALGVTHDSIRITNLARIGRGRSYLGMGRLDSAALSVTSILDGYSFDITYTDNTQGGEAVGSHSFWTTDRINEGIGWKGVQVVNNEGGKGLPWYVDPYDIDPRLPVTVLSIDGSLQFPSIVRQEKFMGGTINFPLAKWVEARLIEVEYYLSNDDPRWLTVLNSLREHIHLPPLSDPGSALLRVDILFRERAYWMFLEGVRLSDLRRKVRQYGRSQRDVYPSGVYTKSSGDIPFYGDAWVFAPSRDEFNYNTAYEGCIHKNY